MEGGLSVPPMSDHASGDRLGVVRPAGISDNLRVATLAARGDAHGQVGFQLGQPHEHLPIVDAQLADLRAATAGSAGQLQLIVVCPVRQLRANTRGRSSSTSGTTSWPCRR
jgi:hypothetical protein